MNSNIAGLTLRAIDKRGWAIMEDKPVDSSAKIRGVAVPLTVLQQIDVLRNVVNNLLEASHSAFRQTLERALDGSGPFLLVFEDDNLRPMAAKDLSDPWLDEWEMPKNLLRVRLRMGLTELGVSNELIFRQMGHVNNGLPPFDDRCPVSLAEHSQLLNVSLDRLLKGDGWEVLPAAIARDKTIESWGEVQIAAGLKEKWETEKVKAFRQWLKQRKGDSYYQMLTPPQRQQLDDEIGQWVVECLKNIAPHHTADLPAQKVEVREEHILQWMDSLVDQNFSRMKRPIALRKLRATVVSLRHKSAWKGVLPPRLFDWRYISPPFGRPHIEAARLLNRIRVSLLEGHQLTDLKARDQILGRLAALLILDYVVFDEDQLAQAVKQIEQGALGLNEKEGDRFFIQVKVGDRLNRSRRLSLAATIAAASLGDHSADSEEFKDLSTAIVSVLPPSYVPRNAASILPALFELQHLAIRIDRPGVLWPLLEKKDPQTLDLERTRIWLNNGTTWSNNPQVSTDGSAHTRHAEPEAFKRFLGAPHVDKHRSATARLEQYRKFRTALHSLCESTASDQNLDHLRYKKLKELCRLALADARYPGANTKRIESKSKPGVKARGATWDGIDPTNRLLVEFALELLSTKKKIRVRTIYDYLTGIGMPMLRALDDRGLQELDGDDLEDVFDSVIEQTPASRKSGVASRLLRFYLMFEDRLADADLESIRQTAAADDNKSPVRAAAVTERQYLTMLAVFDRLHAQGAISFLQCRQARTLTTLMWRVALRSRESTHRTEEDVLIINGRIFIYIRATTLGLVKTKASRRLIDLTSQLTDEELSDFKALRENAKQHSHESTRKSPPLFLLADIGERAADYDQRRGTAADLLKLIRICLKHVTGLLGISLHSLRHSAASRNIEAIWIDRPTNPATYALSMELQVLANLLGHSGFHVSFQSYFHLEHLTNYSEPAITSRGLETLTLEKAATIRKRRSRLSSSNPACKTPKEPANNLDSFQVLDDLVESVRQEIYVDPTELIAFMAAVHLGGDISRLLSKMRCGENAVRASVLQLYDIGNEGRAVFIGPVAEASLGRALNLDHQSKSTRFVRVIPKPRALRNIPLLQRWAASLSDWVDGDLERLIRAVTKKDVARSEAETRAVRRITDKRTDQTKLLCMAWLAGLLLARRRSLIR